MIKGFKDYLKEEASKEIVFTFGRFNPPTIGHEKLLNRVVAEARGAAYRIYISHSEDPKKNPLSPNDKVSWLRTMFPRFARAIVLDDDVDNALQACTKLYDQGFTKATMVVGEDRVLEFRTLLNKYNGEKLRDGFYNFKGGVNVISAGERDPDAEGVSGMSSSKMRAAAAANDLDAFCGGLPAGLNDKERSSLFNAVRTGLGLRESKDFRKHIKLESVSARREAYVAGEIFGLGDQVILKESDQVAKINFRGSNYVIVEKSDGSKVRKWLDGIEPLVEALEPQSSIAPIPVLAMPVVRRQPITNPTFEGKSLSKLRNRT